MTTTELNEYIKHYLEEDKTKSAIMLNAPWGAGKSYYIQNTLREFLKKNGKEGPDATNHRFRDQFGGSHGQNYVLIGILYDEPRK